MIVKRKSAIMAITGISFIAIALCVMVVSAPTPLGQTNGTPQTAADGRQKISGVAIYTGINDEIQGAAADLAALKFEVLRMAGEVYGKK